KRFDERIWIAFEARRQHEEASLSHDPGAVLGESWETNFVLGSTLGSELVECITLRPLPVNDEPPGRMLARQRGEAFHQDVEALLTGEPSHRHDGLSTFGARCSVVRLDMNWVGDDLYRNAEAIPGPGRDLLGLHHDDARRWIGQSPSKLMNAAEPRPVWLIALGDHDRDAEPPRRGTRHHIHLRHAGEHGTETD